MSAVATHRIQRSVSARSCRRALTLLELVLVLALIVIIIAVAVPSIRGTLSNQQLKKSADLVRAALTRARVKAMRSGQIQAFHFQVGGEKYTTIPWYTADGGSANTGDASSDDARADPFSIGLSEESAETLPEGITFFVDTLVVDERSDAIGDEPMTPVPIEDNRETPWSPPLLLYPDGTASDARIVLANERGWTVAIDLRGLNGIARVGLLQRVQESR